MPAKGSVGVALSPLRPAGRAEFDGRTFDVRSVGDYVEAGTAVRTLGTEGSSLLVEAAS
jgi:membrane-bound serine protease (ClpP class)